MADKELRLAQNASGRFYVDETCTDCDLCRQIAPDVFSRDDDAGLSYVFKQPETAAEVEAAREALDCCPTESIGDESLG